MRKDAPGIQTIPRCRGLPRGAVVWLSSTAVSDFTLSPSGLPGRYSAVGINAAELFVPKKGRSFDLPFHTRLTRLRDQNVMLRFCLLACCFFCLFRFDRRP